MYVVILGNLVLNLFLIKLFCRKKYYLFIILWLFEVDFVNRKFIYRVLKEI